jgi:predicted nucleotidyltransferase
MALKNYLGLDKGEVRKEPLIPLSQVISLLGESLSGVLLFGSVARGEQRESSDIDVMIVVGEDLPLTRSLYERWDRGLEGIASDRFSPHFVHLPGTLEEAGSIWFEAAVDAVVLFDKEGRISRFLIKLRRSMADGELQRRMVYGHPYWIKRGPEVERVQ